MISAMYGKSLSTSNIVFKRLLTEVSTLFKSVVSIVTTPPLEVKACALSVANTLATSATTFAVTLVPRALYARSVTLECASEPALASVHSAIIPTLASPSNFLRISICVFVSKNKILYASKQCDNIRFFIFCKLPYGVFMIITR